MSSHGNYTKVLKARWMLKIIPLLVNAIGLKALVIKLNDTYIKWKQLK